MRFNEITRTKTYFLFNLAEITKKSELLKFLHQNAFVFNMHNLSVSGI